MIKNYTTSVATDKTIMEITRNLVKHGASQILTNYENGEASSISFIIHHPQYKDMPFMLPADSGAVLRVLREQKVPRTYQTPEQATRVAWRIVKDWIAAQMALLETEMVTIEQIFLPYLVTKTGRTLYDDMVGHHFQITGG